MADEDWLEELADLARDEHAEEAERLDRWQALSEGRLTDDEVAALQTEAKTSEEASAALEAFRPLGPEFEQRMVEAARFQLGTRAPAEAPAKVLRPKRWWIPTTLAAALAFLMLWTGDPSQETLPQYGLRLEGGVQIERSVSTTAETPRFTEGSRLRLVLTPDVATADDVDVRLLLDTPDGLLPLEAPTAQVSEAGAVLIEGQVGRELRWPEGELSLMVLVGHRGQLPSGLDRDELLTEDEGERPWQALMVRLVIGERVRDAAP